MFPIAALIMLGANRGTCAAGATVTCAAGATVTCGSPTARGPARPGGTTGPAIARSFSATDQGHRPERSDT